VILIVIGLCFWARHLAGKPSLSANWRRAFRWAPSVMVTLWAVLFAVSLLLIYRVFGAVEDGDPAYKASRMAEGISVAINFSTASCLVWVPITVFFAVIAWRHRASAGRAPAMG
jgi:hypothetical protein